MNLIEKLGLEKCKAIIDGAPESTFPVKWGLGFKTYFRQVGYFVEQWHEGKWQTLYSDPTWVDLETLRAAIADLLRDCGDQDMTLKAITTVIERVCE